MTDQRIYKCKNFKTVYTAAADRWNVLADQVPAGEKGYQCVSSQNQRAEILYRRRSDGMVFIFHPAVLHTLPVYTHIHL